MPRETIRLTTTGRHSGRKREATLYAFPDEDRLLIVGSRGGAAHDPAWALNLRAEPAAEIRRDDRTEPVVAREATGEERDRLWAVVTGAFRMDAGFQKRTKRTIPVFVLEPTEPRKDG